MIHIELVLSDTNVLGMVDTSATHNFISEKMVQSLGIKVGQSMSWIKTENSDAQSVWHGYRSGNSSWRLVMPCELDGGSTGRL